MARRGFLDYVLGGAVGGLEGLAQKRAAEEEKARMATALARQVRMDAMEMEDRATAKEDRAQAQKDRSQNQRQRLLAGGYLPTGRDMPGATPRQPVSTEMVDGQEFGLYSTPRQLALQAAMEDAELKARFNPDTMTPYQVGQSARDERRVRLAERNSARDNTDKAKSAGISKIIGGAGKIVEASRNEEKTAQAQLDKLDRSRPDVSRWAGTQADFDKANAAWQTKVDAAEKRLEAAQGKTGRLSPTYERSLVSSDTTGYGEAFGPPDPAPPVRPSTRSFDLFSPASGGAGKEKMREDLWDSIKLQNPTLSDSAITARVKKEIP
jgi:hypothetical protein